ncbi:MAG: hypothetical protein ACQEQF_04940 [Bacillota bacterium]
MAEQVFKNYITVAGTVQDYGFADYVDGKRLGELTLRVNDGNAYINIWNSKNADKNHVAQFFQEIEKGRKIQIQGRLEEQYYDNEYRRRVKKFANKKIEYTTLPEDHEEKYVGVIAGNVLDVDFDFVDSIRFEEDNMPKIEFTVGVFNLYNRETQENDLTVPEVIKNEINNYLDYNQENDGNGGDISTLKKLLNKLDGSDLETCYKVLNKFYNLFNPNTFNIDMIHVVGYGDLANELSEKLSLYDNIDFAALINNYQERDEFEVVTGYVNEVEIKKYYEINKYDGIEDDDFLDI